jgi:transposase-like protein
VGDIVQIWDRLSGESTVAYKAFEKYLYEVRDRALSIKKFAEKHGFTQSQIGRWRRQFDWEDRAEAYDRFVEVETKERRSRLIDELAYRHIEDIERQLKVFDYSFGLYAKKLKERGSKELEGKSLLELRELMMQDLELKMKALRLQKELVELTPEWLSKKGQAPQAPLEIKIIPVGAAEVKEVESEETVVTGISYEEAEDAEVE